MSSTGRADRPRFANDDYPTPKWCVHRLLEAVDLPAGLWWEPCAGAGAIIEAVAEVRDDVRFCANEINQAYYLTLSELPTVVGVTCHDAQTIDASATFSVGITNPPFEISENILVSCLSTPSMLTVFLQRLNWCGGPRAELFRTIRPSVYVLPNRPSFRSVERLDPKTGKVKKSSTDSIEYAWFVFDGNARFEVLADTPKEIRASEKAQRKSFVGEIA